MDIQFDNQPAIHLFWVIPLLAGVYFYGSYRKHAALARFASANLFGCVTAGISFTRQKIKACLVL
ncbi:MAG: hypothetical protein IID33_09100, partial [Planctomycetes bacterium]|nr:hypothetical protein [Planctomycetota bacterium]